MPIVFQADTNGQQTPTVGTTRPVAYTARFFDTRVKLTGKGAKTGLLNERRNPANVPSSKTTNPMLVDPMHRLRNNGTIQTTHIPMFAISSTAWKLIDEIPMPNMVDGCHIADDGLGVTRYDLRLSVHSMTAEKDTKNETDPNGNVIHHPTNLDVVYRVDLLKTSDPTDGVCHLMHNGSAKGLVAARDNTLMMMWTQNPSVLGTDICDKLEALGMCVNRRTFADYMRDASLYDLVCERSRVWQTDLDEEIRPLFTTLANIHDDHSINGPAANALVECMMRLESWTIPLEIYRRIYHDLCANFTKRIVAELCKSNLNIMLSELMERIGRDRATLNRVAPKTPVTPKGRYNAEQVAAIASTEPLALIQACAGSGKTTTIMGRVEYMIDCGIAPSDICVISFTNAAADHVHELNPNIKSMTIDSLIVKIYQHNFPEQAVSTTATFCNGLDVYYPNDSYAMMLKDLLTRVDHNVVGSYTSLNRYVEAHIKDVVKMCQTIGHVTLSLAIIICYQLIDKLVEPNTVKASHLIMDEVQDTSIFQFVYTLAHVHHYRQSLFFVGDSSQTLYEFRFADPRALNVMESSGVFATYKLQTNYRSVPEILEMANATLEGIEANQIAKLRLQSNELRVPTPDQFRAAVLADYVHVSSKADLRKNMTHIVSLHLRDYIEDKLAKNEQITVLSHNRADVKAFERAIQELWPTCTLTNLVPKRGFDTIVLSRFVKLYWNDVRFLPVNDRFCDQVLSMMEREMGVLDPRSTRKDYEWVRDNDIEFARGWRTDPETKARFQRVLAQFNAGTCTQAQFFDEMRRTIFDYESRVNIDRQMHGSRMNNKQREEGMRSNSNFLLSTIHSAKGLEWGNVIVIYNDEPQQSEDAKRMYYVALTRAMDSEFILAYGHRRPKTSIVLAQRDAVIAKLESLATAGVTDPTSAAAKAPITSAPDAGTDDSAGTDTDTND